MRLARKVDPWMTSAVLGKMRHAADALMRYPFPVWHYGDSIGFEGLLAASQLLGDERYASWVHGALKGWAARRSPFREIDNTAAGHVLCEVAERWSDAHLLAAAGELADYLLSRRSVKGAFVSFERAPLRLPYGGATLTAEEVLLVKDPGPGIFVDCMHFDLPFFAHLGTLTGNQALVQTALDQALAYIDLLQDETGLFWHFWLEKTSARYGYGWGRGQGWALLGMLDLLRLVPQDLDGYKRVFASCQRLCRSLLRYQDNKGAWRSVVTDAAAGPEASTAAFMAAGFARAIEDGCGGSLGPGRDRAGLAVDAAACGSPRRLDASIRRPLGIDCATALFVRTNWIRGPVGSRTVAAGRERDDTPASRQCVWAD
jgi:unsaturated rhamnogalacturonyl hydrolase